MSGRPDYDVGDLVVCVDASRMECTGGLVGRTIHTGELVTRGRVYRVYGMASGVLQFGPDAGRCCGCLVARLDSGAQGHVARFRKVDPLPDALTSLLATEPVREGVPA